jgi:uncharacterized protein (DUF1800 family)
VELQDRSARRIKEGVVQVTRRDFLKLSSVAAAATAAPVWAGTRPRPNVAWKALTPDQMPEPDVETLLLNRAAFGPRPGDIDAVRSMGWPDWLEQQLDFESIDNSAAVARVEASLPTLRMSPDQLRQLDDQGRVQSELHAATVYYMIFSQRLLHETMVEFWSDHFAIFHQQNECPVLKTPDDRDVIRPNALGYFKDLLTASARSPAMLNFLDNDLSTVDLPNENYAREIMELHTLGVATDGYPYTEEDVKEVARCFTGWSWNERQGQQNEGMFEFRPGAHDNGSKTVLGTFIPASQGIQDGYDVIDILHEHEATPRYIAYKLIRRYVTDDPATETPELLERVSAEYRLSDGGIPQILRAIFHSEEFRNSFGRYGGRLSRPMDLVARTLRALDVTPDDIGPNIQAGLRNIVGRGYLATMGQVPFYWPTPDGYPDVKSNWTASATMLARWNMGLAAAGASDRPSDYLIPNFNPRVRMPDLRRAGDIVDYWIDRLLHRPMLDDDRRTVVDFLTLGGTDDSSVAANDARIGETIALILDSPYFQWR